MKRSLHKKAWNPDIDGLESSDGNWTASDSVVSKRGKNKDSFGKKQYFFFIFCSRPADRALSRSMKAP